MKNLKELSKPATDLTKNVFFAGLGVAATVEERSKKVFDNLVEKGRTTSSKLEEKIKFPKVNERAKNLSEKINTRVKKGSTAVLNRLGVPGREEILDLTKSVELLTKKVKGLQTATKA